VTTRPEDRRVASEAERRRTARKPTIREVARLAGVGAITASRALGSGELVKSDTRERVLAAAQQLGYRPSRAARMLRGASARIVGVMIPDLGLPLYGPWLRGAGDVARRHGYVLLVCDGQNSQSVIDEQLDRLHAEAIDGLVIAGPLCRQSRLAGFVAAGVPIVPEPAPEAGGARQRASAAETSERRAATAAFRRLVALGHRRIAYVAHVERDARLLSFAQRARIEALQQSLAEVDAVLDEGLVLHADGPDECRERLAALLATGPAPTAIVPGSEGLTPAALGVIGERGLRIPQDVSVVGFGDSAWEQSYRPPLSVVRHDYLAVGRAALENLIARIEGAAEVPPFPPLRAEFVERESCAAVAPSSRRVRSRGSERAKQPRA